MMTCPTVADHEWGGKRLVSAYVHPTQGRRLTFEERCSRCGRVRTSFEHPTAAPQSAYWHPDHAIRAAVVED